MANQTQYIQLTVGVQYSSDADVAFDLTPLRSYIEILLLNTLEYGRQKGALTPNSPLEPLELSVDWVTVQVDRIDEPSN